ncbi:MAG: ABC transporter permease [Boseongicola sp. SB0673_bin_14]|nr:ABC transporter permease [Boseongicola sp.]MYI67548.1 ABC transporter permease [Boseongicola sp. SB0673_bin_14]
MVGTTPENSSTISQSTGARRVRDLLGRLFREKKLGAVGLIIVLVFLLVGIFADVLATHEIYKQSFIKRLQGPSADNWLGTDQFGRDVYSRVVHGARISMLVGISASLLAVAVATFFGLILGYVGGWIDMIAQRVVDAVQAFPWLFLIITVMSLSGPGIVQVIIVLGVPWGIVNIRTVRSVVLSVKEAPYVEAARAAGASTPRILIRHIAPQIVAPMIVLFTISVGGNILAEAAVSFLGFGIPPPQPSWGSMLSLEGRKYMLENPFLAFWPGLCLAIVVFGVNMFGDALRDLLDPRLRGGVGRFDVVTPKALGGFTKRITRGKLAR